MTSPLRVRGHPASWDGVALLSRSCYEHGPLKISLSATNPCHLYPLGVELAKLDALGMYYSGYPQWKLPDQEGVSIRTHSLRTTVVYGLLKYAPPGLRPHARSLFRWQDHGLDRWVGSRLEQSDFIHAMPGQARETFRGAKKRGIRCVLNHATGPVREWVRIMEPEYARAGLRLLDFNPYDAAYFAREEEEYALADFHCAASSVVAAQLEGCGIPKGRIWIVPYGADERIFHPTPDAPAPASFQIAFAGQISLRKGLGTLLEALTIAARPEWTVHFYGGDSGETGQDFAGYRGSPKLVRHGAVSQEALAEGLRTSSVLVLPSLEEGFGLVVPQALNCGTPAIVSDRVGGGDLVVHRENGSIFPVQDAVRLAEELAWWAEHARRLTKKYGWGETARTLLAYSTAACPAHL